MPADAATLDALRRRVAALERTGGAAGARILPLGPAAIDAHLPWGGLPAACLHEVVDGDGVRGRMSGAASAFAASRAAPMAAGRPLLWITGQGRLDLYAPGLAAFGLAPAALIVVQARGTAALWAMEEALREPGVGAVVAEIAAVGLTASRRLQLAAEAGGAGAFLLRSEAADALPPTASVTRWRVSAVAGGAQGAGGAQAARTNGGMPPVGAVRWRLELVRCRGGRPASWMVEWRHATGDLTLAAALPDRPAVPAARGGGRPRAHAVAV